MSRITQILKGKKVKPLTELEHAVKYAVDHAGGGGGGELPDVSDVDNGSVLTVIDGKWGKAYPIHSQYIDFDVTDGNYSTDIPIALINNFHDDIVPVVAKFPMNSGVVKCPLIYADETTAIFSCVSYGENGITTNVLMGYVDDGIDKWR